MKIVSFDFVTHFGGAQKSTALLCKELQKTEEVEVIDAYGSCNKYIGALAERSITTHVLSPEVKDIVIGYEDNRLRRIWSVTRQLPAFFKLRRRLIKRILQIKPDLIWTNSPKALFFLAVSPRLRKFPVAIYARGWHKKSMVSRFARFLIKHHTDCVLALSNPTKESLIKWGVPREKVHVVFTTIDFEEIIRASKEQLTGQLPGMDKYPKILVPATLLRTKGQHTAIQAAQILKQKGLDFVMWLAGDVSMGDRSGYTDYLHELIRDNGLEETVYMLGWRSDVPGLMRLADSLVLPTHTEGLGRVIAEAMLLRLPVISTPVGGVTDLIIDGETGLLIPVNDEKALAEGLEKLMSNKDFAHSIADKAFNQMFERFSPEKHIELVKAGFQYAIEKKP